MGGAADERRQQGRSHPQAAQQRALPTRTRSTARRLVSIGPMKATVAAGVQVADQQGNGPAAAPTGDDHVRPAAPGNSAASGRSVGYFRSASAIGPVPAVS